MPFGTTKDWNCLRCPRYFEGPSCDARTCREMETLHKGKPRADYATLKILTVCQKGVCRSVGTRLCLCRHDYKNVISIGETNTSKHTFEYLCYWTDIILLAAPRFSRSVLTQYRHKIDDEFTIGTDIWRNPQNKELQQLLEGKLSKLFYF